MPDSRAPLSVVVPVKNEEANIAACLASVAWAGEVWVVDSASADCTVEIAQAHGANVVQFVPDERDPSAKKKNWALDRLPFAHEWVLLLDADERTYRAYMAAPAGPATAAPAAPPGVPPSGPR